MRQADEKMCTVWDKSRVKDQNAATRLVGEVARKKHEIRDADTSLAARKSELRSAEASAMLLPALAGIAGGLAGRLVLGTIAEGMAMVSGAVRVERIKGEVKEAEDLCARLREELARLENLLDNAQVNAAQTVERMRAAGECSGMKGSRHGWQTRPRAPCNATIRPRVGGSCADRAAPSRSCHILPSPPHPTGRPE